MIRGSPELSNHHRLEYSRIQAPQRNDYKLYGGVVNDMRVQMKRGDTSKAPISGAVEIIKNYLSPFRVHSPLVIAVKHVRKPHHRSGLGAK